MTASTVNGSGNRARSGAQTLVLLASPLNVVVLQSLATGPKRQIELRRECSSPAQSTLRVHLRTLEDAGAIVKHRRSSFPGSLAYELEKPGEELLFVVAALESWLDRAPEPCELGGDLARTIVRALADGWSSTMLRALAAKPLSLTELDNLIDALNYPSLERRLTAMRHAGLVTVTPGNSKGKPYAITEWLRRALAPILAACRWEQRHRLRESPPLTRLDVETGLLLGVPLLSLSAELCGSCRLVVELPGRDPPAFAGVILDVEDGRVASCTTRLAGEASAWAAGSVSAWFQALIDGKPGQLDLGGECALARSVLEGLHRAIFIQGLTRAIK